MQGFYLSTDLWLSSEWHNPIMLEGGAPLIWTMLHSPTTRARCLIYSWQGHLDYFLPWANGQTKCMEQIPLICQVEYWAKSWFATAARWHQQPNCSFYGNHEPATKSNQQPMLDLQQQEKPQMLVQPITSPSSPREISLHQAAQKTPCQCKIKHVQYYCHSWVSCFALVSPYEKTNQHHRCDDLSPSSPAIQQLRVCSTATTPVSQRISALELSPTI